jgi:hypothetical protein
MHACMVHKKGIVTECKIRYSYIWNVGLTWTWIKSYKWDKHIIPRETPSSIRTIYKAYQINDQRKVMDKEDKQWH